MKVTKQQFKQIVKEELKIIISEGSDYRQHQGGWYGTGSEPSSPAQSSGLSSDEAIQIRGQLKDDLEKEYMDWILDENVIEQLEQLGYDSGSAQEYRLKIKNYLNDNSDNFGYAKLGDAVLDNELEERCQKGYKTHPKRKTKKMYGKTYRNCVKA